MNTRDLLLTHALKLFAARGYDAVGVQELVAAAGVTKPTLYHHFGSKEGVLTALLAGVESALLERLDHVGRYRGDLSRHLQEIVRVYLAFARAQPDLYRLLATSALAPPGSDVSRLARPLHDRQRRLLTELFEAASRDHGNMRGRARRYADSFIGLVNSYLVLVLLGEVELDARLEHDIVHQFSHGIYS